MSSRDRRSTPPLVARPAGDALRNSVISPTLSDDREDVGMDQNDNRGGAAPALAAHSKDASAPGQTPASSVQPAPRPSTAESDVLEKVGGVANEAMNKVGDTASRLKDTMSEYGGRAAERASEYGGRAAEQASDYVHKQPLFALAVTALVCLMIGARLGRR